MTIHLPKGFRFAGVAAGIKASGKNDVALIVSDGPSTMAGVYTQNQVVAAPVVLCRERTPLDSARAIVVNSGNANACTGKRGELDATQMCAIAAAACGATAQQVLPLSTGVIGHQLPMDKVEQGIKAAADSLDDTEAAFLQAADGILTTDKSRKVATRVIRLGDQQVTIAGIAKGAGMIGPKMATLLCCLMTDAKLSPSHAQRMLQAAANQSFNNISVEGHTSTNDTMLLMANGASEVALPAEDEAVFESALIELSIELAKQIPEDGEGATHTIELTISGAKNDSDARQIAEVVAMSNLVKTAVYGNDPNWGRIVSAAGYAGVPLEIDKLNLKINDYLIFENGEPLSFDESVVSASMKDGIEVRLDLSVGSGPGKCTHWTSDLGVAYVRFNSEYTT